MLRDLAVTPAAIIIKAKVCRHWLGADRGQPGGSVLPDAEREPDAAEGERLSGRAGAAVQRRSPERDREGGGPPPSATYGSNAISRARLIATATCRWCRRHAPLIRRDRIFPRSDVYLRSCSTFL